MRPPNLRARTATVLAVLAHELRTPVAAIVAAADSLYSPEPAVRERSAVLLTTQCRQLARLVEDLLEMSRLDVGVLELWPEPVDLAAVVADAIELTAPGVDVTVRAVGDPVVRGEPRRLHTVVRNLLANAAYHGAEPIGVTIDGTRPAQLTITVKDSGPGIPEDLMPMVFDRFIRGDQTSHLTGGSGLGLAIAKENVRLHHGQIEAGNDAGAEFTVTLPR